MRAPGPVLLALAVLCGGASAPDVIVVGAGVGGLTTALESARGGARVTIVERGSVFGGHAVIAEGGLSFAGTPLQKSLGLVDSVEMMFEDMVRIGEDADRAQVRRYVDRSRAEVHDWLQAMGVRFQSLGSIFGSRVPRYHLNPERGFGIVAPIYRSCLREKGIDFAWNTRIERLVVEGGRVVGVEGTRQRTGERFALRAPAVVLATGGFQSNLELVKKHWPAAAPAPTRLLSGAGIHADGSGLAIAAGAGAATRRLDHQWNYPRGIPDPRHREGHRGLSLNRITFPWINQSGRRFVQERTGSHLALQAMLEQPGARAWLIFDQAGKDDLEIAGTDWTDRSRVERLVIGNSRITTRAATLEELAARTGIAAEALALTVARWNRFVDQGEDPDFGRFSRTRGTFEGPGVRPPRAIRRPPFHAIAIHPITRKSLGGLAVDLEGRVLDGQQRPIAGLYAVGEVTGFAGINGKASLEGTFIAPTILQGRITGRLLATTRTRGAPAAAAAAPPATLADVKPKRLACAVCHPMDQLLAMARPGYWHFDQVHTVVLREKQPCVGCHAEMTPYHPERHQIDRAAQVVTCARCHLPQQRPR
jgi:uncharacterized protein